MEFEPMLTPKEKSPLLENFPEEDRTRDAVDSEPKHYQRAILAPRYGTSDWEVIKPLSLDRIQPWIQSKTAIEFVL